MKIHQTSPFLLIKIIYNTHYHNLKTYLLICFKNIEIQAHFLHRQLNSLAVFDPLLKSYSNNSFPLFLYRLN